MIHMRAPSQQSLPQAFLDAKTLMEDLYQGVTGFGIPERESQAIIDAKGAPTYGEILFESWHTILHELNLTTKDVVYDLGSGVGKVIVEAFLVTPAKKVVGVELSDTRYEKAAQVAKMLKKKIKKGELKALQESVNNELQFDKYSEKKVNYKKKKIAFIHKNFLKVNFSDATVIYMCSTCFSDELMQELTDKFAGLRDGLKVVTLKQLPSHPHFTLVKKYTLPMTWSTTTPVYVYEMNKPHTSCKGVTCSSRKATSFKCGSGCTVKDCAA